jgi:hypothetical protein
MNAGMPEGRRLPWGLYVGKWNEMQKQTQDASLDAIKPLDPREEESQIRSEGYLIVFGECEFV